MTGNSTARWVGWVSMVAGVVLAVVGVFTWFNVSSHLAAENITVAPDAAAFGGATVNNPWTAYYEADIINTHALEATGGKTYAQLGRDDPLRATAQSASFLRASLFTSVVAFGVALMAIGLGIVVFLIGFALHSIGGKTVAVAPTRDPVAAA